MTITSVAVIGYFAADTRGEPIWRRVIAPVLATAGLGWILWLTIAQFDVLLDVDPTSPLRWAFPASFAVAAALGLAWAILLKAWRPDAYAAIGLGAHAAVNSNPFAPTTAQAARAEAVR
ncbi:hypothetical protein [Catellatospora chokoriensis]|nr:hypothetical protein [Catellatospora chokoriensis]